MNVSSPFILRDLLLNPRNRELDNIISRGAPVNAEVYLPDPLEF